MTTTSDIAAEALADEELRLAVQRQFARHRFTAFIHFCTIAHAHGGYIKMEMWPHLVALAHEWDQGQSQVVLKARQLGISWLLAAYALWTAQYKPAAVVLLLSQGEDEAKELLDKARTIWSFLPPDLQEQMREDNKANLRFQQGGQIIALPATEKAGRSYTATVVIPDEAAFHPYGAANYAAYVATIEAGGQLLMVSTANGQDGLFHDLFWQCWFDGGPYKARFIPWRARPDRDDAWHEEQKRRLQLFPEMMAQEFPSTPQEAFVAATGLVFPMYDETVHIGPDPCVWEQYKVRVAGVDFGGGDPTAVIPLGVTGMWKVHQPDEFYQRGACSIDEIANYLMKWHYRAPFDSIECDGSEPVAITSLQDYGLPAVAADRDRNAGLNAMGALLAERPSRFTMAEHCVNSRREFPTYRRTPSRDPYSRERYLTRTPVGHHGDAMDARRYGYLYIVRMGWSYQVAPSLPAYDRVRW